MKSTANILAKKGILTLSGEISKDKINLADGAVIPLGGHTKETIPAAEIVSFLRVLLAGP